MPAAEVAADTVVHGAGLEPLPFKGRCRGEEEVGRIFVVWHRIPAQFLHVWVGGWWWPEPDLCFLVASVAPSPLTALGL